MFRYVPKKKKTKEEIEDSKKPINFCFKRISLDDSWNYEWDKDDKKIVTKELGIKEGIYDKRKKLISQAFKIH